ncbi:MAG: hypothetical protein AMS17_05135 [Spirochaetes bacterium DG_61]|jgi:hypothetical protein|nr:MAG: hypothetical protein AMS17_05135 [Spirochaetes bacterium DG_61]
MKKILFLFTFLLMAPSLFCQEIGFMGINIGMSRDEVLGYADANELLHVPKNRDVEFFPVEERKILALSIEPEVPHLYLQFHAETLYALTVIFDEHFIDYLTLAERIEEKYGPVQELTPRWRKWTVGEVEIKVEKPAVVKYIALKEFLEVTGFEREKEVSGSERRKVLLGGL